MGEREIFTNLSRLLRGAATVPFKASDRIVIFSDLHMGDGGRKDDFRPNAEFFLDILRKYYLEQNYKLILNGDVEELHKFSLHRIVEAWEPVYALFREFRSGCGLYKVLGNHDIGLGFCRDEYPVDVPFHDGIRLQYNDNSILVFHGHQGSLYHARMGTMCEHMVRYVVKPLGFRNYSTSHDNTKKYKLERRIYSFARRKGIAALIGHTHRPVFESLSKVDILKFEIEQLCREYAASNNGIREETAKRIRKYSLELDDILEKDRKRAERGSLYHTHPLVPCLFNAGCVIGKRGMTAVEIVDGKISLVHWFDERRSIKYFNFNGYYPQKLEQTPYHRVVLNSDELDYMFARIELLT